MAIQLQPICCSSRHGLMTTSSSSTSSPRSSSSSSVSIFFTVRNHSRNQKGNAFVVTPSRRSRRRFVVRSSGGGSSLGSSWGEWWRPPGKGLPSSDPCLSDVLWPSAGAFVAMTILGRLDQMMAPRGLSFTIAPLGAVCAVLFTTPNSPAAQKYNMFVAQIGCAAFGVLALSIFGPGWLARATAVAASIAFMIITGTTHPPAASLPILFIDGAKFHRLHLWYAFFPGATGCILLCLIQEMVSYLKNHYKF